MGSKLKVVDLATNEVNSYTYGSKRIHETKTFKDNQGDLQARRYYYSTNSWYQNIYYAPHQKVLLRSVSIGREIPVGEPLQGRYPSKNGDDIYVVIELFNNEFKKIGEVPNTVFYNDIFSTEDGIFITDYLHDEDNEDIISFLHYKLMPTTK
jgi:hypothetical protein